MLERPFKIAFVGSHGVGKTTLCYGLAARLKALDVVLDVVYEVARRCPLPINHDTTLAAQSWILHTQIAEEVLAAARHDLVICDRSVLDNYVYLLSAAGRQPRLEQMVDSWLPTYDLLVHVPITEGLAVDGLRSTDPSFQELIEQQLLKEIAHRGIQTLELGETPRERWIEAVEERVLEHLGPAQLRLL